MTKFICPEVNENPGRHFNFGQGGDPVCALAWSPWQQCGTQEPLLGGCYGNLGDLKALLGGQRGGELLEGGRAQAPEAGCWV